MSSRFSIDHDLDLIDSHLAETQGEWGVTVIWYRWDPETERHDVYDVGAPRRWQGGVEVPVQFALPVETPFTFGDQGTASGDRLVLALSKAVMRERLAWADELDRGRGHLSFIRDRIRYEGKLYKIDKIEPSGEVKGRDTMISVQGREVQEGEEFLDLPEHHDHVESDVYDGL